MLSLLLSNIATASYKLKISGNKKISDYVISDVFNKRLDGVITPQGIKEAILDLYKIGFFSDIRVYQKKTPQGVFLTVELKEKPIITEISFSGLEELKESEFREHLKTKIYKILNEEWIVQDLAMIGQKYKSKGYFLASMSYHLERKSKNEVKVVFTVSENAKVLVGDVEILGNKAFSSGELIKNFMSRPFDRISAISSSSIFNKDFVNRDTFVLSEWYREHGYAKVRVSDPIVILDKDVRFARLRIQVEEGDKFYVNKIRIKGDIGQEYSEEELVKLMELKKGSLFKHSHFRNDIEMINDKYGDLGFAYVDVEPMPSFDDKNTNVDIIYNVTKGKKVYFGKILIEGNNKTHDNVIRRELLVSDGDLYNGKKLLKSKFRISRLGFFEDVIIDKEPSSEFDNVLDVFIKVKEKKTGQLNAALGFSPGGQAKASWFGQFSYSEKNQLGRAWSTNYVAKWSSSSSHKFEVSFLNPHLDDSPWSMGFSGAYEAQEAQYASGIEIPEKRYQGTFTLGRTIFEQFRAHILFKHLNINQEKSTFMFEGYESKGSQNSLTVGVSRNDVDNYIDPTHGTTFSFLHKFSGGSILGGSHNYMESSVEAVAYQSLNMFESFKTYFKLRGFIGFLWKDEKHFIPETERYRLGGYDDLRGYPFWEVSPVEKRGRNPFLPYYDYHIGGDKKLFFQAEYFIPLIPEVGIKMLLFADIGQVFLESEPISFKNMKSDVGFGFRWLTPMAPLRFEWAYPYDSVKNKLGSPQFIFTMFSI